MKNNIWKVLIIIGIVLLGVTLVKFISESTGLARANTFGYIQIAVLLCGILLIAAGLVLKPGSRERQFHELNIMLIIVFILPIFFSLPRLLNEARVADQISKKSVSTLGDDPEYQMLAVNMLYGEGFIPGVALPLENYHLDLSTPWGQQLKQTYDQANPVYETRTSFFRSPGFPLLLTITYALFGNNTLSGRIMLAVICWLTALLLLFIGIITGSWASIIAGGLSSLYYLYFYPGNYYDLGQHFFSRFLSEGPTSFWLALFCFLFILYLKKPTRILFLITAVSSGLFLFQRANFLVAFPFLLAYLYFRKISIKSLITFGLIAAIPVIAWSVYASVSEEKMIFYSTQAESDFPKYNNHDVLDGIGADHSGQGGWQAGREYDADGKWLRDRNAAGAGENGYIKGLSYWIEDFDNLPRLFYVKLRRGFFYDNSWSLNILHPEGIYLISIGYLLLASGFRRPKREPCLLNSLSSQSILTLQLILISILFLVWNQVAFWLVVIIWILIGLLAVFRPYGDVYQLPFPSPTWYLSFVICHFVTTILYAGYRYHWPMDVPLMFFGLLGIILTLFELIKRKALSAISFMGVLLIALRLHYL